MSNTVDTRISPWDVNAQGLAQCRYCGTVPGSFAEARSPHRDDCPYQLALREQSNFTNATRKLLQE